MNVLRLNTKYVIRVLVAVFIFLFVLNALAIVFYFNGLLGEQSGFKIFKKLYFDHESNLPTLFNTILFLIAAFFLSIIFLLSKQPGNDKKYRWLVLSMVFLFLAIDESVSFHEFLGTAMAALGVGGRSGFFYFAWIIPYAVVCLLFVLYFFKFLISLDPKIKIGFTISGFVFVVGAMGVEMLAGKFVSSTGQYTATFAWISTIEESLEMTGLILFIHYILAYIRLKFDSFSVKTV